MHSIWDRFSQIQKYEMAKGLCNTLMDVCTKDTGWKMLDMDLVMRDTYQVISIEEILWMVKLMDVVFMNGEMAKFTMVTGSTEWKKAKDFGKTPKVIITSVNGKILKLMGMESMYGRMVTNMKVNGLTLWNMAEEQKHLLMETNIVENTIKEPQMVKELINGKMDLFM